MSEFETIASAGPTSREQSPLRRSRTLLTFGIVGAAVITASIALQLIPWQGARELHTVMEVLATSLAAMVGVLALVCFYSNKKITYLLLATGFMGTALLDGYHAVVTSSLLNYLMPSPPESLIPWSWNASRTFLAILMTIMWVAAYRERKHGKPGKIHEGVVYLMIGGLTLTSFVFFAFTPLSRAYYPEFFFGRPEEFIAATFFAIALFGFTTSRDLRFNSLNGWLVWSLLVGFVSQAVVMSRSFMLFDTPFDLAHLMKIGSYGLVLTGLMVEIRQLFRRLEESRVSLRTLSDGLFEQTAYANSMAAEAEAASLAKSEFLANMSHEIRTPMTAILGYTDLLAEGEEGPQQRLETIDTIRRNADHLLTIINDMSKIEVGKMSVERIETNPAEIVEEVASLMRLRAAGKSIDIRVEYEGAIPEWITSDPTRLRQILMNLVGNAIKFTDAGSVTIGVSLVPEDGMRFAVIDSGIGMTQQQCDAISRFDAFTQADGSTTRKFGGSGLGLRISNSLAQILGGGIEVESEQGKGSTFTVTIDPGDLTGVPMLTSEEIAICADQIAAAKSKSVEAKTGTPLEGLRILLAEDGPDNQRLISFLLKKAGAEVEVAENGRIAIESVNTAADQGTRFDAENGQIAFDEAMAAQSAGQPFDVIMMDMQMPVLDGYGATRKLRDQDYTGPIIALTAHAMSGDRQKCLDAGCDDYTTKPIDRGLLISLVEQYSHKSTNQTKVAAGPHSE